MNTVCVVYAYLFFFFFTHARAAVAVRAGPTPFSRNAMSGESSGSHRGRSATHVILRRFSKRERPAVGHPCGRTRSHAFGSGYTLVASRFLGRNSQKNKAGKYSFRGLYSVWFVLCGRPIRRRRGLAREKKTNAARDDGRKRSAARRDPRASRPLPDLRVRPASGNHKYPSDPVLDPRESRTGHSDPPARQPNETRRA